MYCVREKLIPLYLNGLLNQEREEEYKSHLLSCQVCRYSQFEKIQKKQNWQKLIPDSKCPSSLIKELREKMDYMR